MKNNSVLIEYAKSFCHIIGIKDDSKEYADLLKLVERIKSVQYWRQINSLLSLFDEMCNKLTNRDCIQYKYNYMDIKTLNSLLLVLISNIKIDAVFKLLKNMFNCNPSAPFYFTLGDLYNYCFSDRENAIICYQMVLNNPKYEVSFFENQGKTAYYVACFHLSNNDYENGVKALELAKMYGNIEAINKLGDLYLNGIGVTKDENKAQELLENAISQGEFDLLNRPLLDEKSYNNLVISLRSANDILTSNSK